MKNSKILTIKTFDQAISKKIRPFYIIEDFMPTFTRLLRSLFLRMKEKLLISEIFYFRDDLILPLLKMYKKKEGNYPNIYYLRELQTVCRAFVSGGAKKYSIRLNFEDTLQFLNEIEVISAKSKKTFYELFKYGNEHIMAIYEVFILNRHFADLCENLQILEKSDYFVKNVGLVDTG